jgi:hypothetical protein
MLSKATRPSSTASTMWAKLSSSNTMSAAERATSVPTTPMATPMSARRSAGASFTPSPVMATTSPQAWSAWAMRSFCSGATRRAPPRRSPAGRRGRRRLPGARRRAPPGRCAARPWRPRRRRWPVVAGHHDHPDPDPPAAGDRLGDLGPDRVGHPHQPEELQLPLGVGGGRGHLAVELAAGQGQHPQPVGGEGFHVGEDGRPPVGVELDPAPADPDEPADLEDRLRRAFGDQLQPPVANRWAVLIRRRADSKGYSRTRGAARSTGCLVRPPLAARTSRAPRSGRRHSASGRRVAPGGRRCRARPPAAGPAARPAPWGSGPFPASTAPEGS